MSHNVEEQTTIQPSTGRTDNDNRISDDEMQHQLNEISIINNSEEVNKKPKTVSQLPKLNLKQTV